MEEIKKIIYAVLEEHGIFGREGIAEDIAEALYKAGYERRVVHLG